MFLAAFTRGSDRGFIYIEGDFTNELRNILRRIPGLMRMGGNPISKFIPPSERIRTLRLPKDRELQFTVGEWVRVLKGKYKGDVGYVDELLSWGGVRLLMVPRLPRIWPPDRRGSSSKLGKRPRSIRPPPLTLFDPLEIKNTFGRVPKKKENRYSFNGDKFENGLLVKDFDASAVSSTSVFFSTEAHSLFLRSQHQSILAIVGSPSKTFPSPAEWVFFIDELVVVFSESPCGVDKVVGRGHLRNVESNRVEAELKSGKLLDLAWCDVLKVFQVGDFVEVVGGVHRGRMGFVDRVDDPDISVVETLGEEVLYFYMEQLSSIDSPRL